MSPRQPAAPKNVAFELLFMDSPQYRARLPMRVQIYPHDATESIVTTVKNFYGLYSNATTSKGVSFEDEHGNTLIARYENFTNNMNVYVRVIEEGPIVPANYGSSSFHTAMPGAASGPPQDYYADGYQSADRVPRQHTRSPTGGVRDDLSESASVTSKEQLGTTDISVDNIVEGGRRKRAKFESSVRPRPLARQQHHQRRASPPCWEEFSSSFAIHFILVVFQCLTCFSSCPNIGATSFRSSSNARGHVEPFRFACSSD